MDTQDHNLLEMLFLQFVLVLSVFAYMYKLQYLRYCFTLVLLCPQAHALYYVDVKDLSIEISKQNS